jgi:hypothetical protein
VFNALVDGSASAAAYWSCTASLSGKSALSAMTIRRATDRDILALTAAGMQADAHPAFAGLHHLLRPILGSRPEELVVAGIFLVAASTQAS